MVNERAGSESPVLADTAARSTAQDQPADPRASATSPTKGEEDDALSAETAEERAAHLAQVEARLVRKMDLQIIPLATMLYLLSFLDRTNIGQARLNGLTTDLGLSVSFGYPFALTILYIPYILFEIPSNLTVKRVGPGRWIPFLLTCWGIVSTLQGIVKSPAGLYVNRAFLGATEAGILPALSLYLTFFYKPHELCVRQALYFTGASLSGAFSGLLSTAISNLRGKAGLSGWSYIFIIEGAFTVLFGIVAFFLLPDGPHDLWWLTEEERALATERLRDEHKLTQMFSRRGPGASDGKKDEQEKIAQANGNAVWDHRGNGADAAAVGPEGEETPEERAEWEHELNKFDWRQIPRGMTDPRVLCCCVTGFCSAAGLYGIAVFSPTIIRGLNRFTTVESQLLSCPPAGAAFIVSVILAFLSDRFRWRAGAILVSLTIAIIGFSIAYASGNPYVQYAAIIVLSVGVYSVPPMQLTWISTLVSGNEKRATSIAFYIVFTNSGGILSTWLFRDPPRYRKSFLIMLILQIVAFIATIACELFVLYERRARAQGKRDGPVLELRAKGWSEARIRKYLGDRHPEYKLPL
ncbi:unnamed protein product [Tilletia controversa]|uniref:Major facilitator superfamily (MFS) profile domain-containing protein n=3 Tax=Tilletia TaxID=13289 RepID=A0A8X7SX25_9BASI|nr:hypothetical protein CF336_g3192 [Tilletia laevis]KAE8200494.1 hypothetical protein CF328_g2947 [Tilletia controversa]KAE8264710.1 hypothetical protein A4X03_0g758 [Tilletia caries]KAE8203625.1 hypothetical protein CF335_g2945 [Tilletia laevis]KAE8247795.1 hypothetical protein A4X06_0g4186 [Tilletia controversa]